MRTLGLRESKALSRYFVISIVLVLFIWPVWGSAQEKESIDILRQMGKAFAGIAEKASPAVVGIKAEKTVTQDYSDFYESPFGGPFDDDFFDHFFRRRSPRERPRRSRPRHVSQGSGFIISSDGYILTNNHLVGEAEKVEVQLKDEKEALEAKVIGTDPDSEVAVIKIDAKDLAYLDLADSDTLEVGEWVIAIGNPFGLSHTVTAGIVSAKGRSNVGLTTFEDFIQTDAAINPGNSGGPLLNLNGKVVGINTAILSRSGGNVGIGLAIPVNMAKPVYTELVEGGSVARGFLGVRLREIDADMAAALELEDTKGVILPEVTEGSAADKAGLKVGDIVIEFDGEPVENAMVFRNRVAKKKPGAKVKILVLRNGKRKTLTAELDKRPSREELFAGRGQGQDRPQTQELLGLTVRNLTDELAERLGYEGLSGVVIASVESGSSAAEKGIREGMLIQGVNRTQVKNIKDFNRAIERASKEEAVVLLVNNGRYSEYFVLPLQEKERMKRP
ncbi:MAG: Do family serine endopeptidase [Planctomycetota bacterium]|jgi:serine protease Do